MRIDSSDDLRRVDFDKGGGLVPVVVEHVHEGTTLMVAWADREALERSLREGEMHFWSRSRGTSWHKGATSGNVLRLVALHLDCDGDTLLAQVDPAGPACHTGAASCFGTAPTLAALDALIATRRDAPPARSYTARLLEDRNLRLKKLGEEVAELVIAATDADAEQVTEEAADLLYHLLVACRAAGVGLADIGAALARRGGSSSSAPS